MIIFHWFFVIESHSKQSYCKFLPFFQFSSFAGISCQRIFRVKISAINHESCRRSYCGISMEILNREKEAESKNFVRCEKKTTFQTQKKKSATRWQRLDFVWVQSTSM